MNEEKRVWVGRRKVKKGWSYHLRWIDPVEKRWVSRGVGRDKRRADKEAGILEKELNEGTHKSLKKASWEDFVKEHVSLIPGTRNRAEAQRTLEEFGQWFPMRIRDINYSVIERYVEKLRAEQKNSTATINKKLRYMRAAFRKAIRRRYIAESPMQDWQWEREEQKKIRVVTDAEEKKLKAAAKELYGSQMEAFIHTALNTGGRRGELTGLTWATIDLEAGEVTFTQTKAKKDRTVPINPDVVAVLRPLQAKTLQAGGPFRDLAENLGRKWGLIRDKAKLPDISIHDLRRTFCTRLARAKVPPSTTQRLMGHADLATTCRFYLLVDTDDLREGVSMLRKAIG